ncbi:DUF4179 domain-containing protein [Brevibacillus ruminantium]|uniref:DUF4179 domain-containing protein n=1 Tax=Brevibacillus ruminantium TaxID=2950604 RepID=A0ABY4WEP7_9BACL|nr:DUF4179 domain-containing protein [Brevibacillus ruminantium]USG63799.1 DUF4179 domain-containing protein [Brevibacillus ruminantium]
MMNEENKTKDILGEKENGSKTEDFWQAAMAHHLKDGKEKYHCVDAPAGAETYILAGIAKAKQYREQRKKRTRVRWSLITVCSLILGLFFSIRFSPAVAAYVSHIPGMEPLVRLIQADKGLQMAAKHGLAQTISTTSEAEDVSFTVDQVIMDQRRMLLFYSVKHQETGHDVKLENLTFLDQQGNPLSLGYTLSHAGPNQTSLEQNKVEIYQYEENVPLPDVLVVKAAVSVDGQTLSEPFSVTVPIDKSRFADLKEKVYPVNQTVTIDGQSITVVQIVVYPTQTDITFRFDPHNTKYIFGFEELRLVDEKGETYTFWGNGVPHQTLNENEMTYFVESSFFQEPEKLVLKASGIRAVDKDRRTVVIDARSKTFLQVPDSRLQLEALRQNDDVVGMDFLLRVDDLDRHRYGSLMTELTDDLGNHYEFVHGTSTSTSDDHLQKYGVTFRRTSSKKSGSPSQYQFVLSHYPTYLDGTVSLPITIQK